MLKIKELLTKILQKLNTLSDLIYPVGSIYMSVNSTSPATLFGGTWERITGQFLLAATDGGNSGASQAAGNHGGEATHTLVENELPSITGSFDIRHWAGGTGAIGNLAYNVSGKFSAATATNTGSTVAAAGSQTPKSAQRITYAFGGGKAHNNMPPYLAVYVWKRTA